MYTEISASGITPNSVLLVSKQKLTKLHSQGFLIAWSLQQNCTQHTLKIQHENFHFCQLMQCCAMRSLNEFNCMAITPKKLMMQTDFYFIFPIETLLHVPITWNTSLNKINSCWCVPALHKNMWFRRNYSDATWNCTGFPTKIKL